jgi:hypothetical protein
MWYLTLTCGDHKREVVTNKSDKRQSSKQFKKTTLQIGIKQHDNLLYLVA